MNDAPKRGGRRVLVTSAIALCTALLGFAFVAAPRSCEWGLAAYTGAGLVVLVTLGALPFFAARASTLLSRFGQSALLSCIGLGAWFGGLFAANVKIVCRLF